MRNFRSIAAVVVLFLASVVAANDYWQLHQRGVDRCERIDPDAYQTGLIFNPAGYRSYFRQSACFQRLAIEMRDANLCDRVRRRWSLFSSGWGYSKGNCRELVAAGISDDRARLARLKQKYQAGPVRLINFVVEKNGNGRDYDIVPRFSAGFAHGYHLAFWILDGADRYLLSESGFHLDGNDNIRMFEYRRDIEERFPGFAPGSTHPVEAELTLSIGTGTLAGRWSPAFVQAEFPASARTQRFTRIIRFEQWVPSGDDSCAMLARPLPSTADRK